MDHSKTAKRPQGATSGRNEQPKRLHQGSPGGGHLRQEYSRAQGESQSTTTAQLHSQLQQHFTELAAKIPLHDLLGRVRNLGFPSSCTFVLNMLERYLRASLGGEKTSQPTDALLALVDTFVLCKVKATSKLEVKGQKLEGFLSPVEEMQLLMAIHSQLEEQQSLELRYCMFEAIFGGSGADKQAPPGSSQQREILGKLVSLCVSLESSVVLSCVATWMQCHPKEALPIAESLYYDFCVLLPDAMDPLLQLANHSPTFARQLTITFTTLHPFHLVGSVTQEVDSTHLYPPIRMLEIVSHWVETLPEFLFPSKLLEKWSELPMLRSKQLTPHSKSPLPGLMQWCVLAPLVPKDQLLCCGSAKDSQKLNKMSVTSNSDTALGCNRSTETSSKREDKFGSLMAKLHANILSVVLSHSQSFGYRSLSSDDIAVVMATLLAFSQQLSQSQRGTGDGGDVSGRMTESVERLAQFLQIMLSCGILALTADDLFSITSTLPQNKLLELVISHHQQSAIHKA